VPKLVLMWLLLALTGASETGAPVAQSSSSSSGDPAPTSYPEMLRNEGFEQSKLHYEAAKGNLERMQLVMEGAEPPSLDTRDAEWVTALILACYNGHGHVASWLLGRGAAVNAASDDGVTPMIAAAVQGRSTDVEKVWKQGGEGITTEPRLEVPRILLEAGAELDAQDKQGRSALVWAAKRGKSNLTQLLLESGAAVDAPDKKGRSALIYAAAGGEAEVAERLLAHGASPRLSDAAGGTAIAWAHKSPSLRGKAETGRYARVLAQLFGVDGEGHPTEL
jgi:ankyrin repeat protein